jgi:putative FmdB family regulatory protein
MPVYEFVCNPCQKTFTKTLTIAEHENEKIVCPDCGSENVEQHWSAFYLVTSRKAACEIDSRGAGMSTPDAALSAFSVLEQPKWIRQS